MPANKTSFKKGNPGRRPGTKNLVSKSAKENIIAVFEGLGGVPAMQEWGARNPSIYYTIYARLIPHEVTGEDGGPIATKVIHEYLKSPAK